MMRAGNEYLPEICFRLALTGVLFYSLVALSICIAAALPVHAGEHRSGELKGVSLGFGTDWFFKKRESSSRWYLRLMESGRYVIVDSENVVVMAFDSGRWSIRDSQLLLTSDDAVTDIETEDFLIRAHNRCGASLLPALREKILEFRQSGTPATEDSLESLTIQGPSDLHHVCFVGISVTPKWGVTGMSPPDSAWDILLHALDRYYENLEDKNNFVFGVFQHRGQIFLVPAPPSQFDLMSSPSHIVRELQLNHGIAVQGVYFRVSKKVYEQEQPCAALLKYGTNKLEVCH